MIKELQVLEKLLLHLLLLELWQQVTMLTRIRSD
jgi:hypothetical protein